MTKNLIKQMMKRAEDGPQFINTAELIEKINQGYVVKRESKFQTKKTFAPSTIAYGHGECPRYWYLAFEGGMFEDNNTPYGVANMTSGTMSHDRIQQAMLDSGIAKRFLDEKHFEKYKEEKDTTEFKITHSDPPIFGWGDAMLQWGEDEIIAEIKTMNNEAFESRKIKGEPKSGHIIQLLIYMKILKKAHGVLIYENKNNHELLVFPIEATDYYIEWINNTFEWMRTVYKSWKDKELPQKNYRSNSRICKSCPLKTVCATADIGTIKIPSLEGLRETV